MSSAADAKRGVGLWAADAKRGVGLSAALPADDGERFLAPPDGGSSVGNGSSSRYQDLTTSSVRFAQDLRARLLLLLRRGTCLLLAAFGPLSLTLMHGATASQSWAHTVTVICDSYTCSK